MPGMDPPTEDVGPYRLDTLGALVNVAVPASDAPNLNFGLSDTISSNISSTAGSPEEKMFGAE